MGGSKIAPTDKGTKFAPNSTGKGTKIAPNKLLHVIKKIKKSSLKLDQIT